MSRCTLGMVILALLPAWPAPATDVPYLSGRVTDNAEILGPAARQELARVLAEHENRTSNQVVVLTVTGLQGESVEEYAGDVFAAWKLGQKGKDNGVLLLVAPRDRRLRIEVGYGLEGTLTDAAAGRIIRDVITPRFKEGNFDGGVLEGVRAILAALEGREAPPAAEVEGPAAAGTRSDAGFDGPDLGLAERVLFGAFIFGIIGLFTVMGVITPGLGWFLYFFLIPFWAMFPIIVVGVRGAIGLLFTYLVAFPIAKLLVSRSDWYRRAVGNARRKRGGSRGVFSMGSGGGFFSSSGSSGGGGFSGGGGSSGGGGASGRW